MKSPSLSPSPKSKAQIKKGNLDSGNKTDPTHPHNFCSDLGLLGILDLRATNNITILGGVNVWETTVDLENIALTVR